MSKHLIIIAVLGIILLGMGALMVALAVPRQGRTDLPAITPAPSVTMASTSNKNLRVVGIIQSLGEETFSVTVPHNTNPVVVVLNDRTNYATFAGEATFDDLQIGQKVEVKGQVNPEDHTLVANRVQLLPPAGKVTAINGQVLTLLANGKTLTVTLSNTTRISVGPVPISLKAIQMNDSVGYDGTVNSDGSVSATKIWLLVPHISGTVTAISNDVLTIHTIKGTTVTVELVPDTIYVRGGKSLNQGTPMILNTQAIRTGGRLTITYHSKLSTDIITAVSVVVA